MNIKITVSTITKSLFTLLFGISLLFMIPPETTQAQEMDTGVDLYSTYVYRGVAFSGPAVQPFVEFSAGGFALGAWGSQGIDGDPASGSLGFQEMDLYTAYEFDFGFSIGLTDYYFPGTPFTEDDSHAFELNVGYSIGDFSIAGNYIFNEATGAGSVGDDLYFEAGLTVGSADIFLGAGDGWHSTDTDFALVNAGISTSKDIKITDSFTIPLSGAAIYNPDSEQFYILAGISL